MLCAFLTGWIMWLFGWFLIFAVSAGLIAGAFILLTYAIAKRL